MSVHRFTKHAWTATVFTAALLSACSSSHTHTSALAVSNPHPPITSTAVPSPTTGLTNIYRFAGAGMLSSAAQAAKPLVYVPNRQTDDVTVIDPSTFRVVEAFPTGTNPQHVVPSYDMKTLWVTNNAEGTDRGSLTPIDPVTGKPGPPVAVDDPYNLYSTPDGANAIVVAEAHHRLDFRDPHTMAMKFSIETPTCLGINHMDFSADGSYLIATCEDAHRVVKIDWAHRVVVGTLDLGPDALPQDIRLSANGRIFYVADMQGNQLIMIDGDTFTVTGTIDLAATGGFGAHGLYPSRDGRFLYVANRGSAARGNAPPRARGSVSVVEDSTNHVVANWPIPGGGSPDMGGVSADGRQLWLSGRYDNVVYVFDTVAGRLVQSIPITPGIEPHGLCVWPQPGRYSLGHTGNMR